MMETWSVFQRFNRTLFVVIVTPVNSSIQAAAVARKGDAAVLKNSAISFLFMTRVIF